LYCQQAGGSSAAKTDETNLPVKADWIGSEALLSYKDDPIFVDRAH
jgi:hypothetical protein